MQRPFLWSKPNPAVLLSQPRPRTRRPVSSEPPTPPPREQSRGQRGGIIKYKYSEPPSAPAPLMSRPPRLHRYPSVSFDLSPAPSSRGSSLIVDLWWCPRWQQCPLSLVLCPCCPFLSFVREKSSLEWLFFIRTISWNSNLDGSKHFTAVFIIHLH